jgi:hypothetical protein
MNAPAMQTPNATPRDITHAELEDRLARALAHVAHDVRAAVLRSEARVGEAVSHLRRDVRRVGSQLTLLEKTVDLHAQSSVTGRSELREAFDGQIDLVMKEIRRGDSELHGRVNAIRAKAAQGAASGAGRQPAADPGDAAEGDALTALWWALGKALGKSLRALAARWGWARALGVAAAVLAPLAGGLTVCSLAPRAEAATLAAPVRAPERDSERGLERGSEPPPAPRPEPPPPATSDDSGVRLRLVRDPLA